MSFEDLSLALREILHKVSTAGDERAFQELLRIVLSIVSERDNAKLTWLMQILHDEKTYVLTDTEIMPERTLELLNRATMYHVVYELIRSVKQRLECKVPDVESMKKSIEEGNLADLTENIAYALRCAIDNENVDRVLEKFREALSQIRLPDRYVKPPDLRAYLCKYMLENAAKLIEILLSMTER